MRFLVLILPLALGACSSNNVVSPSDAGSPAAEAATTPVEAAQVPISCNSAQDCIILPFPVCCLSHVCVTSPPDDCADAADQVIRASDYDQTCSKDLDCMLVSVGNGCSAGALDCSNAAINKSSASAYAADVAKTRAGMCFAPSGCGAEFNPCCVAGSCQEGSVCLNRAPTASDAGAD